MPEQLKNVPERRCQNCAGARTTRYTEKYQNSKKIANTVYNTTANTFIIILLSNFKKMEFPDSHCQPANFFSTFRGARSRVPVKPLMKYRTQQIFFTKTERS